MKFVISVTLALLAVVAARPDDSYDKYNDFNVIEITSNTRLLKGYTLCFLGDGKCTPEGLDFKRWIPEAVSSSCQKCTEKQKPMVAQFIQAIKAQLPEEWEKLNKKSDPELKYQTTLHEFLEKYTPK